MGTREKDTSRQNRFDLIQQTRAQKHLLPLPLPQAFLLAPRQRLVENSTSDSAVYGQTSYWYSSVEEAVLSPR